MLHTSIGTILKKYPIQNNIIKMIKSNPKYKKLYDNYVKDNESNYFFIPFNDFLQIFSKVFIDKIYTSKFHGKYFEDSWSKNNNTNGGLPLNSNNNEYEEEKKNFGKNPQYYFDFQQEKQTIYVQIEQKDARMQYETEFPYINNLYSSCIIILKTNMKFLIKNFDDI